jgi:hypothetical protein
MTAPQKPTEGDMAAPRKPVEHDMTVPGAQDAGDAEAVRSAR